MKTVRANGLDFAYAEKAQVAGALLARLPASQIVDDEATRCPNIATPALRA